MRLFDVVFPYCFVLFTAGQMFYTSPRIALCFFAALPVLLRMICSGLAAQDKSCAQQTKRPRLASRRSFHSSDVAINQRHDLHASYHTARDESRVKPALGREERRATPACRRLHRHPRTHRPSISRRQRLSERHRAKIRLVPTPQSGRGSQGSAGLLLSRRVSSKLGEVANRQAC